jgi:hypothetical protein
MKNILVLFSCVKQDWDLIESKISELGGVLNKSTSPVLALQAFHPETKQAKEIPKYIRDHLKTTFNNTMYPDPDDCMNSVIAAMFKMAPEVYMLGEMGDDVLPIIQHARKMKLGIHIY